MSGGYGFATPTTSRSAVPPPQFPMGLETPSRGSSRAFSPSPLRDAQRLQTGQTVPASQVAAFAAVDQSILARKVGLPSLGRELHPIPFPNLRDAGSPMVEENNDGAAESKVEDPTEDGEVDMEEQSAAKEEVDQNLVTISHVLTNVIVLQEFLLELAALVQVRAGLFEEVRFV